MLSITQILLFLEPKFLVYIGLTQIDLIPPDLFAGQSLLEYGLS